MTLSRRTLLRGAAGAALGLPVLDAMLTIGGRVRTARGAAPQAPRRLVVVFSGNGILMEKWRCTAGATERDFALSPILSPLASFKNELLLVEGLAYLSAQDKNNQGAQGHPAGTVAALTGYYAQPGNMYGGSPGVNIGYSRGPSIDYAIAKRLGSATRFPSFYVGAQCDTGDASVARRCFYTDDSKPIVPVGDPKRAYTQLFGELDVDSSNVALQQRLDERKLVLASVREEMRALRCKLAPDDRVRLDKHEAQIASVEERLLKNGSGAACEKPAIAATIPLATSNLQQICETQNDLIAMAFACDLTRVVGYQIGISDSGGDQNYGFLGFEKDQHATSHLEGNDAKGHLEALGTFQARQIADLVQKLSDTPDVEGSLFDNTTIVWMSEVGNAWAHDTTSVAMTIIGRGRGYFDTGRQLKVAAKTPHNRMLLHLLHYMGLDDVGSFGAPGNYNDGGPLAGIT